MLFKKKKLLICRSYEFKILLNINIPTAKTKNYQNRNFMKKGELVVTYLPVHSPILDGVLLHNTFQTKLWKILWAVTEKHSSSLKKELLDVDCSKLLKWLLFSSFMSIYSTSYRPLIRPLTIQNAAQLSLSN